MAMARECYWLQCCGVHRLCPACLMWLLHVSTVMSVVIQPVTLGQLRSLQTQMRADDGVDVAVGR